MTLREALLVKMMPSNTTSGPERNDTVAKNPLSTTRFLSRAGLASIILIFVVGNGMILGYVSTQREVSLVINDQPFTVRTHQTTVGALLDELGIPLAAEDIVMVPLDTSLADTGHLAIRKALPVILKADGRRLELRTHARTVIDFLREAGINLSRHDRIIMDDEVLDREAPLPSQASTDPVGRNPALLWRQRPLRLEVLRAVPITVHDGAVPVTVQTTASTVGQALLDEGIVLYLGDGVIPTLGGQVSAGLEVYIQRSKPLVILADGRRIKTRSHGETVSEVLKQETIELVDKDYTIPDQESVVYDNMTVQVIRVQEQVVLEEEPIPFETVWQPDQELELDNQRLDQQGAAGVKRRLVRVVYENGAETERVTEDEWVETPPTTEIIAYGTKIVIREIRTSEGVKTYWREFRALATAYSASTAGTPEDAPWYGRTYMGLPARTGIIAVDRNVIPLGTWLYVPGYGVGLAGDLGVRGRHVDLCFDEDELPRGYYRWVNVYLLTPVPSEDRITWILPSYPRER
jgi:uncharacterized protein YabE (DUF348 family)